MQFQMIGLLNQWVMSIRWKLLIRVRDNGGWALEFDRERWSFISDVVSVWVDFPAVVVVGLRPIDGRLVGWEFLVVRELVFGLMRGGMFRVVALKARDDKLKLIYGRFENTSRRVSA